MAQPLAALAYEQLKRAIVRCELRPGELVVEGELAQRFGMSKTPVREALNLLAQEGLVEVLPRRGTLIAPITVQDVQHTFLLRRLLEPEAAYLAAQRVTDEQLAHLAEVGESAAVLHHHSDGGAGVLDGHRNFHVAVAQCSGVPRLAALVSGLLEQVERFYNSHLEHGGRRRPNHDHHRELLDALTDHDADRARDVVSAGIRDSHQHLLKSLLGGSVSELHEEAAGLAV